MLGPLPDGRAVEQESWRAINRAAVAKMISELAYEEAFQPAPLDRHETRWELRLASGVTYRFDAMRRIWGQLTVRPESLVWLAEGRELPVDDAVAFLADARETLRISPPTFCTYARELYNTLMADARILAARTDLSAGDLAALPDTELQRLLDGHPKAPASKGRLGWGLQDFAAYAPEFGGTIRLFWLAAARDRCRLSLAPDVGEESLLAAALDETEIERLKAACAEAGVSFRTHLLLPVHPWQWQGMLAAQFASEVAAGRLVPLGAFGDPFVPQQSLRTLANARRADALHVKLPITILNTSAWRGVPGKYMDVGPVFSRWLAGCARHDPALQPLKVLEEVAGAFYPHPHYEHVPDAPYQFCEMLGVIWRESPDAHLSDGRRPMMMGALPQRDASGRPIVSALIARSGLSHAEWLDRLFGAVTVPLYHFMCRYGVGFIAHGQNVTVILDDAIPVGVAIKDFQGDADLVDQAFPELETLPEHVRKTLKRRPPAHLLQHLQTGQFASVLRFLSEALADHDGLDETVFYATLAGRLRRYQAEHPELSERFALFDLFRPKVPRIAINRVRFAIGYGDAGERPLPDLGTDLDNPLHLAETAPSSRATARPLLSGASL